MSVIENLSETARANKLNQKVEKVLALDKDFGAMSDEELMQKSLELMERRKIGESESKLMTEAFALVREATWRTLGMKQYPVQIKGGISIAEGNLAEMATGEGKTIVVPLVAYLHALSGENVHVVTSNEYLATRDSEQMSKLFGFLGMNVGLSLSGMDVEQKQAAYSCNITYTTATELGFDYLRDNNTPFVEQRVLNGLNSIVIDEADHILLDDASTPLILSAQESISESESQLLYAVAQAVSTLVEGEDFELEREEMFVGLSEKGIEKLEKFFKIDSMFTDNNLSLFAYCNNALKARTLYLKDLNYVIKNGAIELVSESTGRILEGRQYSHGIHQAIEAKERVKISPYTRTTSNINFQNFFKLYQNLGGMSGTCKTDEDELQEVYGLDVDKIETNKPVVRKDEHFKFFHTLEAKDEALKKRIRELHEQGRPILLGTTSIESSIHLSNVLKEMGLEFNLLNATNEKEESKIIAQAGRFGAITIATNMAGRGTDIKLGGNPSYLAKEDMMKMGFSSDLISFADSHLQPQNEEQEKAREQFELLKEQHKKDTDIERKKVLQCGGLAVIGTSLNSSRRVDNQLRGRAGRQGEPGSSEIYASWDDVKDILKPDDDAVELYEKQIEKLLKKKSIDTTQEIKDKKIISFIEKLQLMCEAQLQGSRLTACKIGRPENLQREAFDAEKQYIIKICDEFDPYLVQAGSPPSTLLEKYIQKLYYDEISNIVDSWVEAKKLQKNNDLCGDFLRKRLGNFLFNPNIVVDDKFLQNNSPVEIKDKLSKFSFKLFQRAIEESRDLIGEDIANNLKVKWMNNFISFWDGHMERLDKAKLQLNLSNMAQNSNAIYDYVKEAYNIYDQLQSNIHSSVIQSTSEFMTLAVETARNTTQEMQKQNSISKKNADRPKQN